MSLGKYSNYHNSGADWLGFIPTHWGLQPLKHCADFVNGCAFKPEQWEVRGTPIIRIENLNGSPSFNYVNRDVEARYHVVEGDLLFGWSGNRGTSFGPFLWPHHGKYYLNQHIFRICNFNFVKGWFYWALKAVTAHVEDQAHGIIGMVHVTKGELGAIKIPIPPTPEQTAIATFLDRETAKIDTLIAEQEKLLTLLAEKRQATISHAVTKGLNPDVPMKDSGVEWLGEVPEHWEIVKGSRIGTLFGSGPVGEDEVHEEGSVPFIKVGSLSAEGFEVANWNWYVNDATAGRLNPYSEFIVFPKRGAAIFLNKVNIVKCRALIDPNLMGWKVRPSISSEYVAYLLTVRKLQELADVSTVPQINNKHIEPERFPMPPHSEQEAIVKFLTTECRKLDVLKNESERAIALLKERRSALISATVTGQIDVRNAVPSEKEMSS